MSKDYTERVCQSRRDRAINNRKKGKSTTAPKPLKHLKPMKKYKDGK